MFSKHNALLTVVVIIFLALVRSNDLCYVHKTDFRSWVRIVNDTGGLFRAEKLETPCQPSRKDYGLDGETLLKVVDCNLPGSRWDYKVKVSHSVK